MTESTIKSASHKQRYRDPVHCLSVVYKSEGYLITEVLVFLEWEIYFLKTFFYLISIYQFISNNIQMIIF